MRKVKYGSRTVLLETSLASTNCGKLVHVLDTSLPTVHGRAVAPDQKQEELTFEDDGDDLMDALGFGETSKAEVKSGRRSEE